MWGSAESARGGDAYAVVDHLRPHRAAGVEGLRRELHVLPDPSESDPPDTDPPDTAASDVGALRRIHVPEERRVVVEGVPTSARERSRPLGLIPGERVTPHRGKPRAETTLSRGGTSLSDADTCLTLS